jgi:hypothetical protein
VEYEITWGGDPEDVCFTTSGVGSLADARAMFEEALADSRWRPGMRVLFDHTQTDWASLPPQELVELPRLLQSLGPEFGAGKMAAAVRDAESFRANRLMANQLDREVPWLGQVCSSVAEAREWLRRSPEDTLPHVLPHWERADPSDAQ